MKVKAKESHQIEKLREKLAERLQIQAQKYTPEALASVRAAIKSHLLHKTTRIPLKKRVSLYDKSEPPEQVHSKFVQKMIQQLNAEKKSS